MEILTESELAERLNISIWTVRKWRLNLGLPHLRTARRIFYRWDTVEKWMSDQENKNSVKVDDICNENPKIV